MRKNLTDIITIFQSVAIQPKSTIMENHLPPTNQPTNQLPKQVSNQPPGPLPHHATNQPIHHTVPEKGLHSVDAVIHGFQNQQKPVDSRPVRSTRVNFKATCDTTDTSELGSDGFDLIKSINKDLKKRQQRSKSSQHKEARNPRTGEQKIRESGRHQRSGSRNKQEPCDCVPFLERIG